MKKIKKQLLLATVFASFLSFGVPLIQEHSVGADNTVHAYQWDNYNNVLQSYTRERTWYGQIKHTKRWARISGSGMTLYIWYEVYYTWK